MGVWNWLFGENTPPVASGNVPMTTNPATGLPMVGDCDGVDVGGNPFGMDLHRSDDQSSPSFGGYFHMGAAFDSNWPE